MVGEKGSCQRCYNFLSQDDATENRNPQLFPKSCLSSQTMKSYENLTLILSVRKIYVKH